MFALGTFISVTDRSDQANNIDLGVGMMLASVGNDGSSLVRKVYTQSILVVIRYPLFYQSVFTIIYSGGEFCK